MSEPFGQDPFGQYGQYQVPEPPKRHRRRTILGLAATAVVAAGMGAGAAVGLAQGPSSSGSATPTSQEVLSTSQIASRVSPALVDVKATLGYQHAYSLGTGIVLTSDGEVLTNNHVINGATSVSVTDIGNGQTYKATVVGYDESRDVAVLQLSGASGLTTATTGDSNAVKVGDNVVGIGNAGGVGGTPSVAPGKVTGLNQSITASDPSSGTSEQLSGLIRTDANIKSGDSGGPLVNSHAQVIGMDTAASTNYQFGGYGSTGSANSGSATEGFAIPINTALSIAKQIEDGHGSSTVHIGPTAFLGVEIANQQSSSYQGVLILGTQPGTPAAKAGLSQDDVITSLDGKPVSTSTDIQDILIGHHPGDKVSITWTSPYGQSQSATLTLGSGPAG